MRRAHLVGLATLSIAVTTASAASAQYCPSYTASSPNNDHDCGVDSVDGTNPSKEEWAQIFDLVSKGPAAWGDQGPTVGDIGQGCGHPEALHDVAARFPCELLKSIAMVESGWRQFCVPTLPSDQVGGASRTIISFDCGYGVGQVTSGMHSGESPDFDRHKVAADPTYNLATGTRILAEKWKATDCVGDNQPTIVEDWYTATWAYNGLAYINNPNNPNYASDRGVYDPDVNDPAPYQEKVFGRIENPENDDWPSVKLAYPDQGDIGGSGSPGSLPEPSCASPTNCNDHRDLHTTMCIDDPGTGGGGGGSSVSTSATNAASTGAGSNASSGAGQPGGGGAGGNGADDLDGSCSCELSAPGSTPSALITLAAVALTVARRCAKRRFA